MKPDLNQFDVKKCTNWLNEFHRVEPGQWIRNRLGGALFIDHYLCRIVVVSSTPMCTNQTTPELWKVFDCKNFYVFCKIDPIYTENQNKILYRQILILPVIVRFYGCLEMLDIVLSNCHTRFLNKADWNLFWHMIGEWSQFGFAISLILKKQLQSNAKNSDI